MNDEMDDIFERVTSDMVEDTDTVEDIAIKVYDFNTIEDDLDDLEDIFDLEVNEVDLEGIDEEGLDWMEDLSSITSIIADEPGNVKGVIGLENIETDLSEEETKHLTDYLNLHIEQYNAMTHAINMQIKERYEMAYDAKERVERRKLEDGGKEGYTRETCNLLTSLITILSSERTITTRTVSNRISQIPKQLNRFVWDKLSAIDNKNSETLGNYYDDTTKLTKENKEALIIEVEKILDTIEPVVNSREETIVSNEEYKNQALKELSKLEKNMKRVEDIDAIYEIIDIIEYMDVETSLSETRYFMEIHAKLAKVMTTKMSTGEFNKKYKEEIRIRVPRSATGIELGLYKIVDNKVRGKFDSILKVRGIQDTETIMKPINYRYKNALVTFSNVEDFEDFRKKAMIKLTVLQKQRNNLGDTVMGIIAGPDNYHERYMTAVKAKAITFPRYTNEDIRTMISGMATSKYFNDYIASKGYAVLQRKVLHPFDTPCRRFLLGVFEQFRPNPNIPEVFENNKYDILKQYLPMALGYLKNLSKHVFNRIMVEEDKGIKLATVVDIIAYGNNVNGFLTSHMVNKEDGSMLTLRELLSDKEKLDKIQLTDLIGEDIGETRDKNVSFSSGGKLSKRIMQSVISLKDIDVEDTKTNSGVGEENENMINPIVIKAIDTEEQHKEYLKSIISAIIKSRNITSDLNIDAIIDKYRENIKPIRIGVDKSQVYYHHQTEGVYGETERNKTEEVVLLESVINNELVKSVLEGRNFKSINVINDPEVMENLLDKTVWSINALEEYDIIKDLNEVMPLVEIMDSVSTEIYSMMVKMDKESIENYKRFQLHRLVGIPTPIQDQPTEQATYSLDMVLDNPTIDIETIVKGIRRDELPTSLIRDIVVLDKILGNPKQAERLGSDRPSRMVERALKGQIESALRLPTIPHMKVGTWNTDDLWRIADSIIKTICLSSIEYTLVLQDIQMRMFFQNEKVAKSTIINQMEDYFVEDESVLTKAIEYQSLLYWVDSVQVLPIEIAIKIKEEKDKEIRDVQSNLSKKPVKVESERELVLQRKRANAHYKLFLSTGMSKYLQGIDRSHVDYKYLTQQPTADGKPGGEFSKYELVKRYEIEDEIEGNIDDLTYLDIVLQVEKKYPKIKDELPVTVVNYIENNNTLTVLEQSTIEYLRKDSNFNLNYKIY